jgi:ATP-dependent Clp protease adaptor protein ClpS
MESPVALPERMAEEAAEEAFEPLYVVIVHNDDVTPYEYVLKILGRVFLLSEELAEHIAWTAHSDGKAVVIVRPRSEAKRLVDVAHHHARMDRYPLTFSAEPET